MSTSSHVMTKSIVFENVEVRFISSATDEAMDVMDNLYVICKEEEFKISFRSENESVDVYVFMQKSDKVTGAYRVNQGRWTTFDHGVNGKTFVAVPTDIEDARELGIVKGSDSNGSIKIMVCRPEIKQVKKSAHRGGGAEESFDTEGGNYRSSTMQEKSMFGEMAIVNGRESNQRTTFADEMKVDRNRDLTFYARLITRKSAQAVIGVTTSITTETNIPYASNVGTSSQVSVTTQGEAQFGAWSGRGEDDVLVYVFNPDRSIQGQYIKRKLLNGRQSGCTVTHEEFIRMNSGVSVTTTTTTTVTYPQPSRPKYTPIEGTRPKRADEL